MKRLLITLLILLSSLSYAATLPEVITDLRVLAGEPVETDHPVTLAGVIRALRELTEPPAEEVPEPPAEEPEPEDTPEEPAEPEPVIPEQFTPETLSGTYYDAYNDGTSWRYDVLTFSEPAESCENENAVSCGDLSVTGLYTYETVWELWAEPEGNVISWDIPGLGRQFLAVCKRQPTHLRMLWKISRGDLIVALREFQCSEEYFFFAETDAKAFIQ